jgi:hypothetical protein
MATLALARHFFGNAAGRAWLDEEGIESLRGVYFSALAGLTSLGLFLPRRFSRQYTDLSALADPEPYRQALMADTLFMISLPALLTAFVAILLAPVMFPDETDHVTLTPLPLTRRQIFGAKLLALVAIIGALVGGMVALFSIAFPAFTHSHWAEASRIARIGAHAAASAAGAVFAFLAVVSMQGLVLLLSPRRLLQPISSSLQCAVVAALVLSVPLVFRLPQSAEWVATRPATLLAIPSAWFVGIEQVLLGNGEPIFGTLARTAGLALGLAAVVAVACYAILYRHFDRIVLRQDRSRTDRSPIASSGPSPRPAARRAAAWRAVWDFATRTLRRNRLSQMLFLVAWAAGVAIVLSGLLEGWMWRLFLDTGRPPRPLVRAAATMPLAMIVMGIIGLRAAFVLPANSRANWVFRQLDFDDRRRGHLAAVHRAFVWLAIAPAIVVSAPVQLLVIGVLPAVRAWALAMLFGLLIVEIVLMDWRRVPFTCTWLPGKRPLPLLVVYGVISLILVVSLGELIHVAIASWIGTAVLGGLLLTTLAALGWHRLRTWALQPLQFEDEAPDVVQTLGLHRY